MRSEELPNDGASTVGEGCSPLGRRHEVTVGEASPPRNAPPKNHSVQRLLPRSTSISPLGTAFMTYRNLSAPSRSHAEQISASVGMFLSRRRHLSVAMRHLPLGEITLVIRSMPRGSVIENVR